MSKVAFANLRARFTEREPRRGVLRGRIEAAVAIVLVPNDEDELELLFIRRAEQAGDPWSGQMALPGGRRDPGDRDLLTTVTRETLEETGIELPRDALLGELDDLAPTTAALPPVLVRPFVFGLQDRPAVTLSREVDLHLWTSLAGLPSTAREAVVNVRGVEMSVPSFLIGPHIVWGMTHRILLRFLDLAT